MEKRTHDKIKEISTYVKELQTILPASLEVYGDDLKTKAACERYFEKIVEAIIDLAFLIIREKDLLVPEEEKQAFDILAREQIITQELATALKNAKGMRNILAHQYGSVDDEIVFETITEEIIKDVSTLLTSLKQFYSF